MTEILNERGRARAGGASLLAAERDWRERGRATSSTGALGARRRTRASHKFDGRTRCAPENEWRERSTSAKPTGGMCDDTFAVAVDLPHLKTKHARASQSGRATSSTGALGARRRTSGENAGFDDSARSAEAP